VEILNFLWPGVTMTLMASQAKVSNRARPTMVADINNSKRNHHSVDLLLDSISNNSHLVGFINSK
jgi:hypothetical protein